MKIEYYSKDNTWQELDIMLPVNESTFLDERSNTLQVTITTPEEFGRFEMWQLFCISNYYHDVRFYVLKSQKQTVMSAFENENTGNYSTHTLTLVGAREVLKTLKVESCAFAEGSYSFFSVVERLCELAKFDVSLLDVPHIDWVNPKLTFQNYNLYNALQEVASMVDRIVDLDFDVNTFVLIFRPKDGSNANKVWNWNELSNQEYIYEEVNDSIAKEVYTEITNVVFSYGVEEPSSGSGQKLINEGDGELTRNNGFIELEHEISKLNKVTLFVREFGVPEDNIAWRYPIVLERVDSDELVGTVGHLTAVEYKLPLDHPDTPFIYVLEEEFKCIPKYKYDRLSEEEKKASPLIYYDERKIYFDSLEYFSNNIYASNWEADTLGEVNFIGGVLHFFAFYKYLRVSVNYSPLVVTTLPMKIANNTSNMGCVFYNQTSSVVDSAKLGKVVKSYIDGMRNGDYLVVKDYTYNEILPRIGDVCVEGYDNFIISTITAEYLTEKIILNIQLNKNHARKYENALPDTTPKLHELPTQATVQRTTLAHDVINVSMDDESEHVGDSFNPCLIPNDIESDVANFFYRISYKRTAKYSKVFVVDIDADYHYFDNCLTAYTSDTILFFWKAETNIIFTTGQVNKVSLPYGYVDKNGQCSTVRTRLLFNNNPGNDIFDTYPVRTKELPDYHVVYDKAIQVDKDKYEQLSFTYEVQYVGCDETIVCSDFARIMLEGAYNLYFYFMDKHWHQGDAITGIRKSAGQIAATYILPNNGIKLTMPCVDYGSQAEVLPCSAIVLVEKVGDKLYPLLCKNNYSQTSKLFDRISVTFYPENRTKQTKCIIKK